MSKLFQNLSLVSDGHASLRHFRTAHGNILTFWPPGPHPQRHSRASHRRLSHPSPIFPSNTNRSPNLISKKMNRSSISRSDIETREAAVIPAYKINEFRHAIRENAPDRIEETVMGHQINSLDSAFLPLAFAVEQGYINMVRRQAISLHLADMWLLKATTFHMNHMSILFRPRRRRGTPQAQHTLVILTSAPSSSSLPFFASSSILTTLRTAYWGSTF